MFSRRLFAALVSATLLLSGMAVTVSQEPAHADSKEDLIRQREANNKRREKLASQLEGVNSDLSSVYLKLDQTKADLAVAETELVQAEEKLAGAQRVQEHTEGRLIAAEAELERIGEEIESTDEEIDSTRSSLAEVVRTSYRSGGANLGSFTELYEIGVGQRSVQALAAREAAVRSQTRAIDNLSELNAQNRNARARQDRVTELITELKAEADAAVVAADEAREAKQQKTDTIASLKADQESLAGELEAQKDQIIADRAAVEAADKGLKQQIAAIVAEEKRREAEAERKRKEEYRRKQAEAKKNNRPAPAPPKAPAKPAPSSGALIPPVPRPLYVTSPYGMRVYPITGGWFMHNGVDLRSSCGSPQVAAAAGTVTATKPARGNGTHGNQVIINHGLIGGVSYVTVYNHLSGFAVSPGQRVSQGQTIGYTGATGMVTGCHVHFEVWKNGSTINPMRLPGF